MSDNQNDDYLDPGQPELVAAQNDGTTAALKIIQAFPPTRVGNQPVGLAGLAAWRRAEEAFHLVSGHEMRKMEQLQPELGMLGIVYGLTFIATRYLDLIAEAQNCTREDLLQQLATGSVFQSDEANEGDEPS